jgi:hypothetical protein
MTTSIFSGTPETSSQRGFRHHVIAFVLVMALLVVLNLATGGPYWVMWVAAGWGLGIALHAFLALRH